MQMPRIAAPCPGAPVGAAKYQTPRRRRNRWRRPSAFCPHVGSRSCPHVGSRIGGDSIRDARPLPRLPRATLDMPLNLAPGRSTRHLAITNSWVRIEWSLAPAAATGGIRIFHPNMLLGACTGVRCLAQSAPIVGGQSRRERRRCREIVARRRGTGGASPFALGCSYASSRSHTEPRLASNISNSGASRRTHRAPVPRRYLRSASAGSRWSHQGCATRASRCGGAPRAPVGFLRCRLLGSLCDDADELDCGPRRSAGTAARGVGRDE